MVARRSVVAVLFLGLLLSSVVSLCGSAIEIGELIVIGQSFQDVAFWDPAGAGTVWMIDAAASEWADAMEVIAPGSADAMTLFGHCVRLAVVPDEGRAFLGLYNPWIGALFTIEFDADETQCIAFDMDVVTDPIVFTSSATLLAANVTESVNAAAELFQRRVASGQPLDGGQELWGEVADRIGAQTGVLSTLYQDEFVTEWSDFHAQAAIDRLQTGALTGPLAVFEETSSLWRKSLVPVQIGSDVNGFVVVLGSVVQPTDLAVLRVALVETTEPVRSASLIRLGEGVWTITGGEA